MFIGIVRNAVATTGTKVIKMARSICSTKVFKSVFIVFSTCCVMGNESSLCRLKTNLTLLKFALSSSAE